MTPEALETLRELILAEHVTTDTDTIASMSRDMSYKSRKAASTGSPEPRADAVVRPTSTDEVAAVVRWANEHHVSIVARGGGSGAVGSGLPVYGGVVVDLSSMNTIGEVDTYDRLVTVGAGTMLDELEARLAESGMTAGHYPQSLALASVGGSIAMRGSGTWSSLHGGIEDRVADLTVVLPSGDVLRTRSLPRASAGPDLKQLFVGAEGTLGIITEVTLRLARLPQTRAYASYGFPDVGSTIDTVREALAAGVTPGVVRIYDPAEATAGHAAFVDEPMWLLVIVFDGLDTVVSAHRAFLADLAERHGGRSMGEDPARRWEERRFNYSWVDTATAMPGGVADSIEVTARWSELPALYASATAAAREVVPTVMAHISHVYADGAALYIIVAGEFDGVEEGLRAYDEVWRAVVEATLAHGGRISHHHGIGLMRAPWMEQEVSSEGLGLLRSIKSALDPRGVLNPGKLGLERGEG